MKTTICLLLSTFVLSIAAKAQSPGPLPNGPYRGQFQTPQGVVPFNFEVSDDGGSAKKLVLINDHTH